MVPDRDGQCHGPEEDHDQRIPELRHNARMQAHGSPGGHLVAAVFGEAACRILFREPSMALVGGLRGADGVRGHVGAPIDGDGAGMKRIRSWHREARFTAWEP